MTPTDPWLGYEPSEAAVAAFPPDHPAIQKLRDRDIELTQCHRAFDACWGRARPRPAAELPGVGPLILCGACGALVQQPHYLTHTIFHALVLSTSLTARTLCAALSDPPDLDDLIRTLRGDQP
jgi:hypothetical protein